MWVGYKQHKTIWYRTGRPKGPHHRGDLAMSTATCSLFVEEKRKTPPAAASGTHDTQWAMLGSSSTSNRKWKRRTFPPSNRVFLRSNQGNNSIVTKTKMENSPLPGVCFVGCLVDTKFAGAPPSSPGSTSAQYILSTAKSNN
ncbi:hypothetical protein EYF80_026616 [Liparis tanakae]|uniref:Uncharacterized protein n=1 Tax=Liparis tanakae TaxID=230148 RepID=A0A4Z2HEE5_9TELE|nr:hypothetical protein EYF80_026616 [Liparis tanakae]